MDEGFHGLKIAAVLLILTLSTGVATARAATSFADTVGDVKGGSGRDLTSISVSHTTWTVMFARDIPNASSSCGSALLPAQLDRTARQFSTVKRTVYSFEGSRHACYEWLHGEAREL